MNRKLIILLYFILGVVFQLNAQQSQVISIDKILQKQKAISKQNKKLPPQFSLMLKNKFVSLSKMPCLKPTVATGALMPVYWTAESFTIIPNAYKPSANFKQKKAP